MSHDNITTDIKAQASLTADVVLGVGAHPDDLDFTAAGTLAGLAAAGSTVYYLILTDGGKGSEDQTMNSRTLIAERRQEQRNAAKLLGAKDVFFLDYEDGALEVTRELKRDVVRFIRRLKPQVVFAIDPTLVYYAPNNMINHSDHRACGQAVLDAVFPLARDHLSFPELADEGLTPHKVSTVMLSNQEKQQYFVDITSTIDLKMSAIAAHVSQAKDVREATEKYRQQAHELGLSVGAEYAEGFVRIDVKT